MLGSGVEVDFITDSDSAYGDELSSYTQSITSSVYDFPYIYQRRYHAFRENRWMLPNDDQENERLDMVHVMVRKCIDDRLYLAPIKDGALRVIDIGTGTGNWAIDFGDEHPSAEVIGNDLTPGPTEVPPNVTFMVDDIEDEWIYQRNPFDFVHARFLAGAIQDWPRLMGQVFNCTKPGGWVEFQDWDCALYSVDNSLPKDSTIAKWHDMAIQAREAQGFSMRPGPQLERWMEQAGFRNLMSRKVILPLGPWPKDKRLKEVGMYNLLQMEAAIEGICLGTLLHANPPWSKEKIDKFVIDISNDMKNREMHCYYEFYIVYGQRLV